jgi:hypothetical protein
MRVSTPTNSDVERWSGPARVSQCFAKSYVLNETFGSIDVLDAILRITPPHSISIKFNLLREHRGILSK